MRASTEYGLGHRDLATTQIYAKVQQDHLRQIISKLSPLVSDAPAAPEASMSLENVTQPEIANRGARKLLN
jgi:hypothetical protein